MTIDEHIRRQEAGELPEGYPVEVQRSRSPRWGDHYIIKIRDSHWARFPFNCIPEPERVLDMAERAAYNDSYTLVKGTMEEYEWHMRAINECRKQRGDNPL